MDAVHPPIANIHPSTKEVPTWMPTRQRQIQQSLQPKVPNLCEVLHCNWEETQITNFDLDIPLAWNISQKMPTIPHMGNQLLSATNDMHTLSTTPHLQHWQTLVRPQHSKKVIATGRCNIGGKRWWMRLHCPPPKSGIVDTTGSTPMVSKCWYLEG